MKFFNFISATMMLVVAACSHDSYNEPVAAIPADPEPAPALISFEGHRGNASAGSRYSAAEAAELIGGEFRVFAMHSGSQRVFDNYVVKWVDTPGTNSSNVAGWDYLGYTSKAALPATQDLKYWNLQAPRYDFVAFAGLDDNVTIDAIDANTLRVDADNMHSLYIADRVSAMADHQVAVPGSSPEFIAYGSVVQFNFRRASARMRIGFYEIIPGYAVKDLRFYYGDNADDPDGTSTVDVAALQGEYPTAGSFAITYDADNVARANLIDDASAAKADSRPLGKLAYRTAASTVVSMPGLKADGTPVADGEGDPAFLGSTAAEAVYAYSDELIDGVMQHSCWHPILPHEGNATPLTLHADYTLVALDGSKEQIRVKGAKATVPVSYSRWQPNYAYTYIFKISPKNNDRLYPITFDASVSEVQDFGAYESEVSNN